MALCIGIVVALFVVGTIVLALFLSIRGTSSNDGGCVSGGSVEDGDFLDRHPTLPFTGGFHNLSRTEHYREHW